MTDPRVDVIIARTIDQFEGGFVNDPDDPGGATNFGITIADLRRWRKQPTTPDDVRAMTRDTAIQIYWVYYWNAPNIGALPDELQPVVFDAGVNLGPSTAIKMLQVILRAGGFTDVTLDGMIGPVTAKSTCLAEQEYGAAVLVNKFCDARAARYRSIVSANPVMEKYLHGWLARVNAFRMTPDTSC